MNRRTFLETAAAVTLAGVARTASGAPEAAGVPHVDLHVHLDNSTIDKVLELSVERGVKFGIVEHAGTKENVYPVVLSNDAELKQYLAMLDGKPVYKGIQAEWTDWMGCFSKEAALQLDYVLSDALTFPGPHGERMKLWEKGAEIGEAQQFMDRYVEWHVEIMDKEPIDILANVSWLPAALAPDYDALWTDARIQKVIDTALKYQVALEISSGFELPKLHFLQMARDAGVKFTLGSNGRYPKMGRLDYSLCLAEELGLSAQHFFTPGESGSKAVQRRWG
jgi:histidinol phosphatase-like PHP family hydrolase